MKKISTSLTLGITLLSVVAITYFTHYMVTKIPHEIQYNIDVATPPKIDTSAMLPVLPVQTPVNPEVVKSVNAFDAITGLTPLMQAAIDSDVAGAKLLLESGANPNIPSANPDKDYALNIALFNGGKIGSIAVAHLLLANGSDVNAVDSRGLAPIHRVMMVTQPDDRWRLFEQLVARGAQMNAQAEDGSTMMHISVTMNDINWIRRVIQKYGQIINYNLKNKEGNTPLQLSTKLGHVSVNDSDSVGNELSKRPAYIGDNKDVRAADDLGRTGLLLATIRTDMQFVDVLTQAGADLAHQDNLGNGVMHYAVTNLEPEKFVAYLIEHKAPVNSANKLGQTPLFDVLRIRSHPTRLKVAQLLVDAESPIAHKDNDGKSVLDLATHFKDQDLVNLFKQTLEKRLSSQEPPQKKQKI